MAIVAEVFNHVVGVDTHARSHTVVVIDPATGGVQSSGTFPTSPAGLARAVTWITKRANGPTLVVIEGAGSYGAGLARRVAVAGLQVVEPGEIPPRGAAGKDDLKDAIRIARAVTGTSIDRLGEPRADSGIRAALRVLVGARDTLNEERTRTINTLTALLRSVDLGLDARRPLTTTQITTITRWRTRNEAVELHVARVEAIRLAHRIRTTETELAENTAQITTLVEASPAADLTTQIGIGPIIAATVLISWSHPGRFRNEAAFAALAGTNPVPASSGNTTNHRLNRHGDRRLNRALNTIAIVRMTHDPTTRAYVERRRTQGRQSRAIKRCLKRYIARQLFRHLEHHQPLDQT